MGNILLPILVLFNINNPGNQVLRPGCEIDQVVSSIPCVIWILHHADTERPQYEYLYDLRGYLRINVERD